MKVLINNRKSSREYEFLDKFIAGVVLTGSETKSIINGNCSLDQGYVVIKDGEVYLKQVHIKKYEMMHKFDEKISETRDRKLLLTKSEIRKLSKSVQEKGLTIIPIKIIYSDTKRIKIEIAISRGKKNYDKRQDLKQKQIEMDIKRKFK